MVTGHLREKNGVYHIVFNYKDENGKRQTPSKSTGLPVRGNKKKAEQMLRDAIKEKHPDCKIVFIVDENSEKQIACQVKQAKKDGLIDQFIYGSISASYLSDIVDSL